MDIPQNVIKVLREIEVTGNIDSKEFEKLVPEEQELINALYKNGLVNEALRFIDSIDVEKNWEELKKNLDQHRKPVAPLWKNVYRYAAIFIGVIGIFFLYQQKDVAESKIKKDNNQIELVLDNGEVQILSANGENQIVSNNGQVIGSQNGSEIKYSSNASVDKLVYNQIKIPYGKTFNVKLSDGTVVYLNSGTVLKYPVKFIKGMNREVFLDGEAYFDVRKDKLHPFIVNANAMNVKVLGTKFNVSSYKEDTEISTVLVEGSVSLSNDEKPNKKALLTPGYKGVWNKSSTGISLEKVDTKLYTDWMNGEVVFRKSTFNEIIKKLERSYNVTIQNNNRELDAVKINASFNKNIETIEEVISSLSKIQPFTYEINDTKIVITK
ncbi:FecR family protein [Flavobacterium sp. LB1P62]|uniref:FecR family protein n=1 Tax=Flavobacterium sp. LB1P62 TaxID=3401715 RepID=UPI003AAB6530